MGVAVAAFDRDCVAVPVLDLVRPPVPVRVPLGVGVTGTHAPHVSPGNPGAPGVADAAMYPVSQRPPHAIPHPVYPTGQSAHGGVPPPVAYCPGGHNGLDDGVLAGWECDAARDAVRVWVDEALAAPSSRKCGGRWDADFVGDAGFVGDPVACAGGGADACGVTLGVRVTGLDRVGERVDARERVGVRVTTGDLDGLEVACGDCVVDVAAHAPQAVVVKPAAQVPK